LSPSALLRSGKDTAILRALDVVSKLVQSK